MLTDKIKDNKVSNKDVNWAKQYDYYEVECRNIYKTISKPQNDSHFEMLKSKAKNYLNKNKVFCEIGFSAGITLRYAMKFFGKVYGLDISSENVEFTKNELVSEGYENFELYTYDLMVYNEDFKNKFDVISFVHGLEHFSDIDYPLILANIKAYLKKDGIFTGALPYRNSFKFRMCPKCNHVFEIDGHISSHDITTLKKVFIDNGFEIVHIDNFNLKYALSYGPLTKKVFRFLWYYLLKTRTNSQLEYIVKLK